MRRDSDGKRRPPQLDQADTDQGGMAESDEFSSM
jgi:hypothetical protein